MTKKVLISLAFEEGHFNGLVDEGEYLRQSLLYKQIQPRPVRCSGSFIALAKKDSEGGTPSRQKTICVNLVNPVKKTSCLGIFVAINPFNQRNLCLGYPRLINDLRSTKDYVRKNNLFLQNEPNFTKVKST
jgi:hypothetical protein